jgi:MFS family permease
LIGCVILGSGLLLHSQTHSTLVVYAARILMGISLGFVGVLPSVVLVTNWFERRRGVALGILLAGTSIGGVVIPPIATPLIAGYGWRTAMVVLSLLIWLVLAPAILLLVKDRPADIGLTPDGDAGTYPTVASVEANGVTLADALRTPVFWIFALGAALIFYPIFVTTQQLILQTARIGLTPQQGSLVLSVLATVSIAGKFLFFRGKSHFDLLLDNVSFDVSVAESKLNHSVLVPRSIWPWLRRSIRADTATYCRCFRYA